MRVVKGGEIEKSVFLGLRTIIAFTIADSRASVLEMEKADQFSSSRTGCLSKFSPLTVSTIWILEQRHITFMLITTAMCRQRTAKVYLYHDKDTENAMHMRVGM